MAATIVFLVILLAVLDQKHLDQISQFLEPKNEELQAVARLQRDAHFAAAMPTVRLAFEKLREASHAGNVGGSAQFKEHIKDSLDEISKSFAIITGSVCRTSVKEILYMASGVATKQTGTAEGDETQFIVKTYCRNNTYHESQSQSGATVDRVILNTDFKMIFDESNEVDYFFCNDIPNSKHYINSHMRDNDVTSLPYRSTIVWPIQRSTGPDEGRRFDLWGFFCVDSMGVNVFNEGTDISLGAAYASTLYSVFQQVVGGETAPPSTLTEPTLDLNAEDGKLLGSPSTQPQPGLGPGEN